MTSLPEIAMAVPPVYRPELPPRPPRIAKLPLDHRGYPVPFFVYVDENGKPDHRVMDARKIVVAIQHRRCWVCGQRLEIDMAFIVGPMCVINKNTAEPPSHPECALYSVKACPFLTKPHAKRREAGLPPESEAPPGEQLKHNPGVMAIWTCQSYKTVREGEGVLFRLSVPTERMQWFTEGRPATRQECLDAQEMGLPFLRQAAEEGGAADVKLLNQMIENAKRYLPKE